jgi:DNA-binding MarR family transcriptional regulator
MGDADSAPADPGTSTAAADPVAPERYDLRVMQALRRIIRAVDVHSRKLSAQHDITGPQLVCLLAVEEQGPLSVSALAREVHLSSSTVIGILDRLAAKDLVVKERDPGDRRLVRVFLTGAGRELTAQAPSPLQDTFAEAMGNLPAGQQATIAGSLERIVELMEVRDLDAAPFLETGPIAERKEPS